jgi:hypothetical protein
MTLQIFLLNPSLLHVILAKNSKIFKKTAVEAEDVPRETKPYF